MAINGTMAKSKISSLGELYRYSRVFKCSSGIRSNLEYRKSEANGKSETAL